MCERDWALEKLGLAGLNRGMKSVILVRLCKEEFIPILYRW